MSQRAKILGYGQSSSMEFGPLPTDKFKFEGKDAYMPGGTAADEKEEQKMSNHEKEKIGESQSKGGGDLKWTVDYDVLPKVRCASADLDFFYIFKLNIIIVKLVLYVRLR